MIRTHDPGGEEFKENYIVQDLRTCYTGYYAYCERHSRISAQRQQDVPSTAKVAAPLLVGVRGIEGDEKN